MKRINEIEEKLYSSSVLLIFTDVSERNGLAGAGIVSKFELVKGEEKLLQHSHRLGKGSNNYAELSAIKLALKYIITNAWFLQFKSIHLFSDSLFSVMSITENWPTERYRPLFDKIHNFLFILKSVLHFKFYWVKAHSQIKLNELADKQAKKGSTSKRINPELC